MADRIRIFFSTRFPDASGQWVSKVSFVDLSKDLSLQLEEPKHVWLPESSLGAFDEHGIFPFSVLPVGEELWAYTTGWSRRVSVAVETGIGLAISRDDGRSFRRLGDGPVLTSSLHEPYLVGDGFVVRQEGEWLMYYIFGTAWTADQTTGRPERTYKSGYAVSKDGVTWATSGTGPCVPSKLGTYESQALPTVVPWDGRYLMLFCYRETFGFRVGEPGGYRLGSATSIDGRVWSRDDNHAHVPRSSFDADMQCYPNTFLVDGELYLLYNGNEFGRHGFGAAKWT